jgi:hypothetical protein
MNDQIEEVELSIKQAHELIDKANTLKRLINNPDFISIVTEGYFEKEPSRLVLLKADPNMQGDKEQKMLDKSIDAIGYLRQYFVAIMQTGRMAEASLEENKNTLSELFAESTGE